MSAKVSGYYTGDGRHVVGEDNVGDNSLHRPKPMQNKNNQTSFVLNSSYKTSRYEKRIEICI